MLLWHLPCRIEWLEWRHDMTDFHLPSISSVSLIYCRYLKLSFKWSFFSKYTLLKFNLNAFIATIVKRFPFILRGSKTAVLLRKKEIMPNWIGNAFKASLMETKKNYALGRCDLPPSLWPWSLPETGGLGILLPQCTCKADKWIGRPRFLFWIKQCTFIVKHPVKKRAIIISCTSINCSERNIKQDA